MLASPAAPMPPTARMAARTHREDAGCGGPGTPANNPVASSTSQAIPPLNEPAGGGTNCDASHIANLDDPSQGLWHDLQSAKTTPSFSWITPNNCSGAHDALCKGNNLSGAFSANG